eukprot:gene36800-37233_t
MARRAAVPTAATRAPPEMERDDGTEYIPGGSGLNTLRVAQWVLEAPGSTTFLGEGGQDGGVCFPAISLNDEPTGTCAVLLNGDNRSLVANLGASAVFDAAWLKDRPELRAAAQEAAAYYVTGFFLKTELRGMSP